MTLTLAPGLVLPDEAVTQTFGVLAKRGAGKSNAGAVMAEEMFKAGLPFVVVDPVGAWWGLRSSANGKSDGLSIPIFGGYRGDVPLEPASGHLMANLIVGENLSAVLDVSSFDSEEAKRRFLADFAERLYLQKGKPGQDNPLHLFLEEADDYIPQGGSKGGSLARCLGAFERIVKRGRSRGLGATMITQRSAAINKDVLTQLETLVVLRTVSPQDRDAVAKWLEYHGQAKEILGSLAELAPGEAWVWSMWLDLTKRVQIRRRWTFDSGATPSVKAKRTMATLADVDLSGLEAQMKETVERAKADDPKELRSTIRKLEGELARLEQEGHKSVITPEPVEVRVEVPVLGIDVRDGLTATLDRSLDRLEVAQEEIRKLVESVTDPMVRVLNAAEERLRDEPRPRRAAGGAVVAPAEPTRVQGAPSPRPRKATQGDDVTADVTLGKGERKVISVLRQWPDGRTYNELAFLAGYSAKASTLGVILSKLRQAGYVQPGNQRVMLTAEGLDAAGGYEALPTGDALLQNWLGHQRMGEGERRVLMALVDGYPVDYSHEELCEKTGYSPIASTMGVILSKLRKLGLVEKGARKLAPEFAESIGR